MKFQAQTVEEKEDWIRALRNGISRAKNKVFDSVNVFYRSKTSFFIIIRKCDCFMDVKRFFYKMHKARFQNTLLFLVLISPLSSKF